MNIFKTLDKNYIKYGTIKINVIIDEDDNVWFKAKETARALGYSDCRAPLRKHVNKRNISQLKKISCGSQVEHPNTLYLNEAGLYSLVLRSKMPKAVAFTDWVTDELLPTLRKYGSYKLKKEYENKLLGVMKKIKDLQENNIKMKQDMKKEKFPKGAVVYVINYSDKNDKNVFRIGMTSDMKKRKQLYDTHMFHKRKVVLIKLTKYPMRLESCIRAMLYDFRYKNKKDFYVCKLSAIKQAFNTCIKSINYMNKPSGSKTSKKQKGGTNDIIGSMIKKLQARQKILRKKIKKEKKLLNI